jgi:hypothetical protein
MRSTGIALAGVLVGAAGASVGWRGLAQPLRSATSTPVAVSAETVYNLRRALFESFQWSEGQPDLGAEPTDAIPEDRLRGVSFPAKVGALSTTSPSVTFDVVSGHSVPELGTTYSNRYVSLQTLPLSSEHIPVYLLADPEHPRSGVVSGATGPAQSPSEFEASLTLDEFRNVLRADTLGYYTREAVFRVYVNSEGSIYMLAELPQGS